MLLITQKLFSDKNINVPDSASTIVTSTMSKSVHNKKVRYKMDCYILHMVLLVIIFIFIIAIICYHYAKHRSKQKNVLLYQRYYNGE